MSPLYYLTPYRHDVDLCSATFLERMIWTTPQGKEKIATKRIDESISWHLTKIFNTRQCSLQHLPGYGLPDLNEIYRNMPSSINHFLRCTVEVIEKYEPRLSQVEIGFKKRDQPDQILEITIRALINHAEKVTYMSTFNANGSVAVHREKR